MSVLFKQQEIKLIKKRHHKNRLAFGIILYHYKTINELITNITDIQQYPKFREISQIIQCYKFPKKISDRTIGNFCSIIRNYFKTSYSKKSHYVELTLFLTDNVLPYKDLKYNDLIALAKSYLKEIKVENFTDKKLTIVINDAINYY